MARIIDYVDHPNVMDDELSHREPPNGAGDFRMGTVCTVQEHQAAVFVSRGKIMDVLGPGQHVLSTANLPILSNLIGMVTNGRNPFTAEIYFINLKPMPSVRWGTNPPVEIITPQGQVMLLMGNGTAEVQITDPAVFMQYAMGKPNMRLENFRENIQSLLVGQMSVLLSKQGATSAQEATSMIDNLEGAALALVNEGFARYGMMLRDIQANAFQRKSISDQEYKEKYGSFEQRLQMRQFDVAEKAAGNEGLGGAAASTGLGFGLGQNLGNMMNPAANQQQMMQQQLMMQQMQQMQQMMDNMNKMQQGGQPQAPAAQPAAAPAASGGAPKTVEEIEAALDALEIRLMNGEISEDLYNKMSEKWQAKLNELKGGA